MFTGHRDIPTDRTQEIAERTANEIRKLIVNHNVRFFGVGGAIGYDMLAARVLFRLRETEFPNVKVILVYPFDGFTDRWSLMQIADHERLLSKYAKVVCVCDRPSREAYFARDRYLVDGSAYCISYCTRNYGGTAHTVRYARQQEVKVVNVAGIGNSRLKNIWFRAFRGQTLSLPCSAFHRRFSAGTPLFRQPKKIFAILKKDLAFFFFV